MSSRVLAVCLHDVEPRTAERCRQIRSWLTERGVERMTLLAIPASEGEPLRPDDPCATWLRAQVETGDAVAQHGFEHRRTERAPALREWVADRQGGPAAEFVGLDEPQTAEAIRSGQAVLHEVGLEPRGFVAPAYAYTATLRREVDRMFDWYGALLTVYGRRPLRAPAHGLGTSTVFKQRTSPLTLRAGARLAGGVLRVDIHPADFDYPRHIAALGRVLQTNQGRPTVTYDELAD